MTMEGARPGMAVGEIQAKTLTRRQKRPDSWFAASIGMNLYRGCALYDRLMRAGP